MRKTGLLALCVVSLQLAIAGVLTACDVPVFRYALERWPVDPDLLVAVEVTHPKREKQRHWRSFESTAAQGG